MSSFMTLLQDLRYGLRMSFKNPAFTLITVATLAVGIAANTTVFSWIDSVLLHPMPGVSNGSELVSFESVTSNGQFIPVCYPDYREYRDRLTLVSGLAISNRTPSASAKTITPSVLGRARLRQLLRCHGRQAGPRPGLLARRVR